MHRCAVAAMLDHLCGADPARCLLRYFVTGDADETVEPCPMPRRDDERVTTTTGSVNAHAVHLAFAVRSLLPTVHCSLNPCRGDHLPLVVLDTSVEIAVEHL